MSAALLIAVVKDHDALHQRLHFGQIRHGVPIRRIHLHPRRPSTAESVEGGKIFLLGSLKGGHKLFIGIRCRFANRLVGTAHGPAAVRPGTICQTREANGILHESRSVSGIQTSPRQEQHLVFGIAFDQTVEGDQIRRGSVLDELRVVLVEHCAGEIPCQSICRRTDQRAAAESGHAGHKQE